MKKLILVVAMVLLSTAAWGQTIYKHHGWTLIDRPDSYSIQFIEPRSDEMYSIVFAKQDKSGVSFVAPDPTAWKQIDSKYGAEEHPLNGMKGVTLIDPKCWDDCISDCSNKEQGSRYRLEKNEVTGEYRITENKNGEWEKCFDNFQPFSNQVQTQDNVIFGRERTYQEMIDELSRLRKKEQSDKAWRPVK